MSSGEAVPLELASTLGMAEHGDRHGLRVDLRLKATVETKYALVWRNLRRLGVPDSDTDDAIQEVFLAFAKRLDSVPEGAEAGFLLGACTYVAKRVQRRYARLREVDADVLEERPDPRANPEERAAQNEAGRQLQEILDELPYDYRCAFVLFELEQLGILEIARALDLPQGTVSSRIRRARLLFERAIQRRKIR